MLRENNELPSHMNAALLLADGTIFYGKALGAAGTVFGEICFNTAMTGYQEIMTDPSYNGQIVTFTFPHIGNVGCNAQDIESDSGRHLGACGLVVRQGITEPSNYRATLHFDDWLIKKKITGISGVDTRALTRHIRKNGAQNVAIIAGSEPLSMQKLQQAYEELKRHPSLKGMELAKKVTVAKPYEWIEPRLLLTGSKPQTIKHHVVAVDYGEKLNILRCLASLGCKITVVPAETSAEEILALKPDGVFLSNGPGDPAATGQYAVPVIRKLVDSGLPVFGICLGHQMLALALGGKTEKMHQGHRGANHPVKHLETGKVEITSQNHGFVVSEDLPPELEVTHRSLFDGTIQGLKHKSKPVFCVQGHPEASPGPHDSLYLFEKFVGMMNNA
ncbi:MAG TPA: glutamine-hydrolyzing carbamoyl-phosphate synthase small subunit [Rickettsiales bacterium]|nr:glutamine-hydrolyzing carbamoyl-phosphate synthase small subunit [Rickettsiales bacterium]